MSTHLTVRTEDGIVEKLDRIAQSLERNRNWVINEALNQYLEMHAWRLERIEDGIAASDAGRSVTQHELKERIQELHTARIQQK